jgi:hypothetical protein
MSSLVTSGEPQDPEVQEEEVRKRDEKEIRDDYRDTTGDDQGREIEHLILVTHGIGQRLGLRMERSISSMMSMFCGRPLRQFMAPPQIYKH